MKRIVIKNIKEIVAIADEGDYRMSPSSRAKYEGNTFEYLADVKVEAEAVQVESCSGKVFAQNYCVDLSEYDDDTKLQNMLFKKLQDMFGVNVEVVDDCGNVLFSYVGDKEVISEANGFRNVGGSCWERLATDEEMAEMMEMAGF